MPRSLGKSSTGADLKPQSTMKVSSVTKETATDLVVVNSTKSKGADKSSDCRDSTPRKITEKPSDVSLGSKNIVAKPKSGPTPVKTKNTHTVSSASRVNSPVRELVPPAKLYNTPGKKLKKVKVLNMADQDGVKIIQRVTRNKLGKEAIGKGLVKGVTRGKHNKRKTQVNKLSLDDNETKVSASGEKRTRSPKKLPTEAYKSRHSIGRRSAGRVSSYKESEVAVLFPDDYRWPFEQFEFGASSQPPSSSDSDDEIVFTKLQPKSGSKVKSATQTSSKSVPSAKMLSTQDSVSAKLPAESASCISPTRKTSQSPSTKTTEPDNITKEKISTKLLVKQTHAKSKQQPKKQQVKKLPKIKPTAIAKRDDTDNIKPTAKRAEKTRSTKFEELRLRPPRIQRTACLNATAINSLLFSSKAQGSLETTALDSNSIVKHSSESIKPAKVSSPKKQSPKTPKPLKSPTPSPARTSEYIIHCDCV